jgi:ATP-dependent DNA helicase RecQ
MQDQVRGLRNLNIPAGCLHSGQSIEDKREVFSEIKKSGTYLLYLSPERVQKPGFAQWAKSQDIAFFAIDEAHCVSQWGPDFRQDYNRLAVLRELKPSAPILALTATATPPVLEDIVHQLGLKIPDRHVHGFYRSNLFHQVVVGDSEDLKVEMIKDAISRTPDGRVLIYCGTRQNTEELAAHLSRSFSGVDHYHAGLGASERSEIQKKLDRKELRILCATNAFGMGIDYPDVRLVVHYQMPANIESYYQEMGRAGRDGEMSRCLLFYSKRDKGLQSYFIQQSDAEPRVISAKWRALDAMTAFAEGGECRHAGILTYFRDSERIKRCGHCDICTPTSDWVIAKPVAQKSNGKFAKGATAGGHKIRKARSKADLSESLTSPQAEVRAEMLKDWRRSYAADKDIAAFIVFSNRTLIELANVNPGSLSELGDIHGFGPHRLESIGAEVLKVLSLAP